jgi:hypothetical protein
MPCLTDNALGAGNQPPPMAFERAEKPSLLPPDKQLNCQEALEDGLVISSTKP